MNKPDACPRCKGFLLPPDELGDRTCLSCSRIVHHHQPISQDEASDYYLNHLVGRRKATEPKIGSVLL